MSKKRLKKDFKAKNNIRKKKTKMGNQAVKTLPSLSKQQASCNWVNYLKSNAMVKKLKKFYENTRENSVTESLAPKLTKVLSLDCEMVGDTNNAEMLARVSVVNYNLECVYDKYVKPTGEVGDYRTRFSGIRKENLAGATDFEIVREEIINILKDKILVGHALHNDLKVLRIKHRNIFIRDSSNFPLFRYDPDNSPSLKMLAKSFLNETIQNGEHCSIEDAQTAMKLYKKFNREWEIFIKEKYSKKQNKVQNVV